MSKAHFLNMDASLKKQPTEVLIGLWIKNEIMKRQPLDYKYGPTTSFCQFKKTEIRSSWILSFVILIDLVTE